MKHWSKFIGLLALSFILFGGAGTQYIQAQTYIPQPEIAVPDVVVNVSFLNVRTGPSTAYTVLTVVAGGTRLPVLGSNSDGSWYQVKSPAGTGWVSAPFVLERGSFKHVPVAETPALPDPVGSDGYIQEHRPEGSTQALRSPLRLVVNTGNLNVRSGPGKEFTSIGVVPGGTVLEVTGFAANSPWFRVTGSFGIGWVDSTFTLLRGNGSSLPVVYP
jgi:uncharacterized protein YraI